MSPQIYLLGLSNHTTFNYNIIWLNAMNILHPTLQIKIMGYEAIVGICFKRKT